MKIGGLGYHYNPNGNGKNKCGEHHSHWGFTKEDLGISWENRMWMNVVPVVPVVPEPSWFGSKKKRIWEAHGSTTLQEHGLKPFFLEKQGLMDL